MDLSAVMPYGRHRPVAVLPILWALERYGTLPSPARGRGAGERAGAQIPVMGNVQIAGAGKLTAPIARWPPMNLRTFSRVLRSNATDAERRLWFHLRARRTGGLKFRRQQPIGKYIVDFVCFEHRLIVEVDGGQHNGSADDRLRDAFLASRGFKVLRFWNDEVLQQTLHVLERICKVAAMRGPSPPAPLPQAGEGSISRCTDFESR